MSEIKVLWVDDEIELLKPHIIFLEKRNYNVTKALSGTEALEEIKKQNFDIVFLDENMPGLTGIETLAEIKEYQANLPVVMITKSEEEYIMEEAIGSKIADYLIKPVNPNQILLSLKKNLRPSRDLFLKKRPLHISKNLEKLLLTCHDGNSYEEWVEMYQKLVYWELELENIDDSGMFEILESQKNEANIQFCKFIDKNYPNWFNSEEGNPTLSHTLFKDKVLPVIEKQQTLFVVIDNLRYDQWKAFEPFLNSSFKKDTEELYYSILPTATQYARNSIFSGLMPSEMEKSHPNFWLNDTDEGGKNMFEKDFLEAQLKRLR